MFDARALFISALAVAAVYPLTWMNAPVTMARAVRCGGLGSLGGGWHVL